MPQFTEIVTIRVPTGFKAVIDQASFRLGFKASEFIRQCVMATLARGGFPIISRLDFPSVGHDRRTAP